MRSGFTLVEVVVALVLLEIGVLAAAGTLVLASRTLARAEGLERAVAALELVGDSLGAASLVGPGVRAFPGGRVRWTRTGPAVELVAVDLAGDTVAMIVQPVGVQPVGAP